MRIEKSNFVSVKNWKYLLFDSNCYNNFTKIIGALASVRATFWRLFWSNKRVNKFRTKMTFFPILFFPVWRHKHRSQWKISLKKELLCSSSNWTEILYSIIECYFAEKKFFPFGVLKEWVESLWTHKLPFLQEIDLHNEWRLNGKRKQLHFTFLRILT